MSNEKGLKFVRSIIGIFCFSLSFFSFASKSESTPWTYMIYIAGDNDYFGPYRQENDRLANRDQARIFYHEIRQQARDDKFNNYSIFYDPLGSAYPFSNKHVRFDYYQAGKRVHTNSLFEGEIDMTAPETFIRFRDKTLKKIKEIDTNKIIFYYYGMSIPMVSGPMYDRSNKDSTNFNLSKFARVLSEFEEKLPIYTLIMHTCYNAHIAGLEQLVQQTNIQNLIIGDRLISNSPAELRSFMDASISREDLVESFLADQVDLSQKFVWFENNAQLRQFISIIAQQLKKEISTEGPLLHFKKDTVQTVLDNTESRLNTEYQPEYLQNSLTVFPYSNEIFMNLKDFLGLTKFEEADYEILLNLLEGNSHLGQILIPL